MFIMSGTSAQILGKVMISFLCSDQTEYKPMSDNDLLATEIKGYGRKQRHKQALYESFEPLDVPKVTFPLCEQIHPFLFAYYLRSVGFL